MLKTPIDEWLTKFLFQDGHWREEIRNGKNHDECLLLIVIYLLSNRAKSRRTADMITIVEDPVAMACCVMELAQGDIFQANEKAECVNTDTA